MRIWMQKILTFHWSATFLLMGVFSALGAAASFNLFMTLSANFRFLSEHGLMAVMEGALIQLGELLANGYFALAMYIGFKACERTLVEKLLAK
ncbi:hypothetical protein [Rhodoblastus sp.]|uniref:hypothetical protein n=1 Tax=Rhodoblastus sp. TaxID=1962975 RepID=UPI003F9D61FA